MKTFGKRLNVTCRTSKKTRSHTLSMFKNRMITFLIVIGKFRNGRLLEENYNPTDNMSHLN